MEIAVSALRHRHKVYHICMTQEGDQNKKPELQFDKNATDLMKACILKQNEKLHGLLKQAKRRDSTGKTALMYASEVANIEAMKLLVQQEGKM